ncbi:MAG: OmcA/MtrC family decaheme c-type cytochrome [Burkholderiales bacterium]|nr:OmcA/MtrC family decaheme c-type cytochrome [Burkholderiales bacterium]
MQRSSRRWRGLAAAGLLAAALAATISGCGGSGGGSASAGVEVPTTGIATGPDSLAAASTLKITITAARVDGKPAVDFTVTNQDNKGMTGLQPADLRFNIAKLVPGIGGGPADWQNYINRVRNGAVQGTQERTGTGNVFGTLVGHGGGAYTYTFATDITNPAANPCPAPCTEANGKPLNIRFEPGLTHRITVQQANSAYPEASGILDFVPAGGTAVMRRDVVATETCNTCHAQLQAHGTRVDTRLCVTCHNPGSWVAGTSASQPNATVDFKVMVHRLHYNNAGAALPSVVAGTPYKIGNADFSAVTFPQDVRNCTRCHDDKPGLATVTAQGNHWKAEPSIEACGACHDNVYFGTAPSPTKPYQTKPHSGGVMSDNSTCASCHAAGRFTDKKDIVVAHNFPARLKAAAARFQFNILSVSGTTPGAKPVVTFSVTDPTNNNKPYDIKADPAFTAGGASTLTVKIGWTTTDFTNAGNGVAFGQPISINALSAAAVPAGTAGTYTVTSTVAVPTGQTGTLRVLMDGHPAGDVTTAGSFTDRLAVKNVFRDVAVSGSVVARRSVVDIAKCNTCHDTLSLHGNNRTNEIGVCTVCHNANATDAGRRPAAGGVDGKAEESVDFKTMVHAIHAGEKAHGGMRTKGITVYGFGGSVNSFADVVFPGRLADCSSCHIGNTYQLAGTWATPTVSGVLGTTVASGASTTDPADNLRMSPTVAVCSSCHDSNVARLHMQDESSGGSFSATQATLATGVNEGCVLCHGEGRVFDVKTVHRVK